jgi:hypothetical protein
MTIKQEATYQLNISDVASDRRTGDSIFALAVNQMCLQLMPIDLAV